MRGSEAVVKLLKDVGVEVIFRLCGDTSLPFYDALASGDHGIRHVLTRDERSASFMADAYARLSGKVGVCEGPAPSHDAVTAAAERLVNARRPLLVAGAGVLRSGAWGEVTVLAELLGMPVATSIGGKGSIAEIHPYSLGVIGSNGGLRFRHDMLRESDVILYVGSRQGSVTTEKWTLPADGEKTLIQMDVEPVRIGHNYETAVGIVADAKLGLAAVTEEVADRLGGRPAEKIQVNEIGRRRAAYMASIDEFESNRTPIRPERFVAELSALLPPRAIICADPGTPCPYLSAYYRVPQAGRWFVSPRAHGALGYALPAVCGAYLARPDAARIVGVMGDGSFGISAGELETIARRSVPVTLIVLNNASYGWIKAGQKALSGDYFSVDFSRSDHAAIAEAYGILGLRVENPGDLRATLSQALTSDGPVLVDIIVQPLEEARAPVSKWGGLYCRDVAGTAQGGPEGPCYRRR